ncbi:MAG: SPASM domain-containing protein, partial [Deltaproteobacteria bacterium]
RVRMVVCDLNVEEVTDYFDLWSKRVDDVLIQPVHHCEGAFYTGSDHKVFELDGENLIRQLDGHPLARGIFVRPLLKSLRKKGVFPQNRCYAGMLMVRIDPWGNVYPCLEQHACVGSIRNNDFVTIWNSASFNEVRRAILEDNACNCWYNNTAMIGHSAKWLYRTTAKGFLNGINRIL